jgi:hypothetical protein
MVSRIKLSPYRPVEMVSRIESSFYWSVEMILRIELSPLLVCGNGFKDSFLIQWTRKSDFPEILFFYAETPTGEAHRRMLKHPRDFQEITRKFYFFICELRKFSEYRSSTSPRLLAASGWFTETENFSLNEKAVFKNRIIPLIDLWKWFQESNYPPIGLWKWFQGSNHPPIDLRK